MHTSSSFLETFDRDFSAACALLEEAASATSELFSAVQDVAILLKKDLKTISLPVNKMLLDISPALALAAADQSCVLRAAAIIFIAYKVFKTALIVKGLLNEQAHDLKRHEQYKKSYARCNTAFNQLISVFKKIVSSIYNYFFKNTNPNKSQQALVGDINEPAYQQATQISLPELELAAKQFAKVPLRNKVVKTFSLVEPKKKAHNRLARAFAQTYHLLEHALDCLQSAQPSARVTSLKQDVVLLRDTHHLATDFAPEITRTIKIAQALSEVSNSVALEQSKASNSAFLAVKKAVASVTTLFAKVQNSFSAKPSVPDTLDLPALAHQLATVNVSTKKLGLSRSSRY